jgi:two-component system chemotaxis response regulator CheY
MTGLFKSSCQNSGEFILSLFATNWNMPKMDEIKLLRTIKDYPDFANISFIMVTSETQKDKVEEAF